MISCQKRKNISGLKLLLSCHLLEEKLGGKVTLQTKQSVNKPKQYLKSYNLKRERVINCDYGLSPKLYSMETGVSRERALTEACVDVVMGLNQY